jgi:hypothetical protein
MPLKCKRCGKTHTVKTPCPVLNDAQIKALAQKCDVAEALLTQDDLGNTALFIDTADGETCLVTSVMADRLNALLAPKVAALRDEAVAGAYAAAADQMKEALEAADAAKNNRGDEWDEIARKLLVRLLFDLQRNILALTPASAQAAVDKRVAEAETKSWFAECRAFAERIVEIVRKEPDRERASELILFMAHNEKPLQEKLAQARLDELVQFTGHRAEGLNFDPQCQVCQRMRELRAALAGTGKGAGAPGES